MWTPILKGMVIMKESKEHTYISRIYGFLLIIGTFLCVCGFIFIPVDTYTTVDKAGVIELKPDETIILNEDVQEFHFRNIDWENNGNCLHFIPSHQEIQVDADGKLLFERKAVSTIWGHSPGFAWEYIEIPPGTKDVTVTVTAS
jgi:hypothetical protein